MAKYISGRSKKTPQSALRDDRYRYLSVADAEPNLGDSPTASGSPDLPVGQQYIIVSFIDRPGERYWIPNSGGIIPGAISVFDEGVLTGGLSTTSQLNFVGAAITAQGTGTGTTQPGVAVTVTVFAPGNEGDILFNSSNDFSTNTSKLNIDTSTFALTAGESIIVGAGGSVFSSSPSGTFINPDDTGNVGVGTSVATAKLHVYGDLRLTGNLFDSTNESGETGYLLTKSADGVLWSREEAIITGAGGTIGQIQFHNSSGFVDGADIFYYDTVSDRVGIGSTQPTQLLDVLGVSTFSGGVFIDEISISGVSTFTGNIDANGDLDVDGKTELDNVNISGITTFGSDLDINASVNISTNLDVDGTTDLDGLNVSETANFTSTTDNTPGNVNTGSVQLDGGAGIAKNLTVGQLIQSPNINVTGVATISSLDIETGLFDNLTVTGISTLGNIKIDGGTIYTNSGTLTLDSAGNSVQIASNDRLVVNNTTQSTSKDTGAIVVEGGVGIEKNLNVGGDLGVDDISATTGDFSTYLETQNFNATGISTISNLKLASGVTVTSILDQDTLSSNSATALATQQSIKAYVDAQVTAQDLDISADTGTIAIDLDSETLTIAGTTNEIETSATGNTVTIGLPNNVTISGTLSANGNTDLGNATTDTVTFNARVDSNLLPSTNGTVDLGGTSNRWSTVYANNFNGSLTGAASTAIKLETARDFSISGDGTSPAVSFDGTANVDLELTLASTGVVAGSYGSSTQVGIVTVDSKGRITSASNINIDFGNANVATANYADNAGISTNLKGGSASQIPYQTAANTTAFIPNGSSGQLLQSNGTSAPSWISVGDISAGTAQTANNLSGGAAGSIPYQDAPGSTVFLTEPNANGYVLTYNNSSNAPQWQQLSSIDRTYTLDSVDSGDNVILRLSDGSTNDDVTITAGSNITIDPVASSGFTISAVAGAGLAPDSTISDLISVSGGTISADDAGADRIFFWDDSESKATHLSVGSGLQISGTTLSATSAAGKTYTLEAVDSGSNAILRLSDGSANDDVLITAGTNITIDPVASGGFTISAVADGGGGGILSDVDVVQENYGCTNPITTATNAGITTITIGEDSNAYGIRYVQETEPTGVCDGDIWYDTSDASGASGSSVIPSGSTILFIQASAPTGWTKVTSHNNKALRIVSGTGGGSGGSTAFTSVFASRTTTGSVDAHTLTISQMPSHTHTMRNTASDNLNAGAFVKNFNYITNTGTGSNTGSTGGNGSHSHGFTGGTMDFAVQYVDAIICQKD